MASDEIQIHGPGPFVTHHTRPHPDGGLRVATSRRHRKGHLPHRAPDLRAASRPRPSHAAAFAHVWAPGRLGWWIGALFAVGSLHFLLGGLVACFPAAFPAALRPGRVLNAVFFAGSLFFTAAAWLQWLEAINADLADAFAARGPRPWRWIGWRPRDLGYLATGIQLIGTLLFNLDTAEAMRAGLDWQREDLLVWSPDMAGCLCFLVASLLAYVEVSQGRVSFAPRSVSWWIAVVNLLGSVAFQVSALYAFTGPGAAPASAIFVSNATTAGGALCFFVGAYLLVPELFDT